MNVLCAETHFFRTRFVLDVGVSRIVVSVRTSCSVKLVFLLLGVFWAQDGHSLLRMCLVSFLVAF